MSGSDQDSETSGAQSVELAEETQPSLATSRSEAGKKSRKAISPEEQLTLILAQQAQQQQLIDEIQGLRGQVTTLTSQAAGTDRLLRDHQVQLKSLERENDILRAGGVPSAVDDRETDAQKFFDCSVYFGKISPGFNVYPPASETIRPHLFDLHGDKTYGLLTSTKRKGALEEYKILAPILLYLSCLILAFREQIHDRFDAEGQEVSAPLLLSFNECEGWLRKRMAFVRAQSQTDEHDPNFVEYLRSEIYNKTAASVLGSDEFKLLQENYAQAKGRASLAAGAKLSAIRSHGAPPVSHPKKNQGKGAVGPGSLKLTDKTKSKGKGGKSGGTKGSVTFTAPEGEESE